MLKEYRTSLLSRHLESGTVAFEVRHLLYVLWKCGIQSWIFRHSSPFLQTHFCTHTYLCSWFRSLRCLSSAFIDMHLQVHSLTSMWKWPELWSQIIARAGLHLRLFVLARMEVHLKLDWKFDSDSWMHMSKRERKKEKEKGVVCVSIYCIQKNRPWKMFRLQR